MANEQSKVLRILDANLNRSMEAMRTIEEYLRFVLDDGVLTESVKQMRHELQRLAARFPLQDRVVARESSTDVGRSLATESEYHRSDVFDVVGAALGRLKESLRALEEYSKVLDSQTGTLFERLRYETYDLEKNLLIKLIKKSPASETSGIGISESISVYVLVDGAVTPHDFAGHVESLLLAGVDMIQLRDKKLDDRTLLARAKQLRALVDDEVSRTGRPVLMIVNDRPDIARIARADGVHLGQSEISPEDARTLVGDECLIGVSTHEPEQVMQAVESGADYIGCGPTFPSSTKEFSEFAGTEFLHWVSENCRLPAFAIGGISVENIDEVAATGFTRVAVSGCLGPDSDHQAVVQALKTSLAEPLLPSTESSS